MKNKIMILAMIAVVGFSAVGCSNPAALPGNTSGKPAAELSSDEIQALQAVTKLTGLGG